MSRFNLSEWALRNRPLVLYFAILLAILGAVSYSQLGQSEDPPFTFRAMVVITKWPGANAEQISSQITERIETKLQEIANLEFVRSQSKPGESQVIILAAETVSSKDIDAIWYQVRKKIGDIQQTFPQEVQGPFFNDEFGDTFGNIYALTGDGFDDAALKDYAKRVQLQLLRLKDVAKVELMGFQDGIDSLIRALHKLKFELGRSDFYCILIGKGSSLESLKSLTKELQLEDNVLFTGFVSHEDLLKYLSTTDICIAPDPFNPFNDRSTMIKVMEYMTLSKPIVAYRLIEHQVTAQGAALYADVSNELDFARKIEELMNAPERRREMGAIGRKRVEEVLAWPHQEGYLRSVYETVFGLHVAELAQSFGSKRP